MEFESLSPTRKRRFQELFTAGFALFSMFFGAGNLIFPLLIGSFLGTSVWFAIIGLFLTAVLIPFLGLSSMFFLQADHHLFFGRIGKAPGFALLLLLQLILGPFGVIPRLVTLMHATAKPYIAEMSLPVFSLSIIGVIFLLSVRKQKLVALLGSILTPVLLLTLLALITIGLMTGNPLNTSEVSSHHSFLKGLLGGYQTMDLIAAFLFATMILPQATVEHATGNTSSKSSSLKTLLLASGLAVLLLFISYTGLCLVSAKHAPSLTSLYKPEELLGAIAGKILGPFGSALAAAIVLTACLTTAMTLAAIFADYVRKDLCKGRISFTFSLIGTLLITLGMANLGFSGIASFLGPILQITYPGLIVLTLLNLSHALFGTRVRRWPVFGAFIVSGLLYCL
jgi:LIVCS family branched-chain amino acid:cation transporter